MRRRTALILAGVVILAAIVALSLRGRSSRAPVKVSVETVDRRKITQTVKATGQIQPKVQVNISAHVIGKIERLFVVEGEDLTAGAPFLQLERQSFLATRDDARARLAMSRTELKQAEVALADQDVRLARSERLSAVGIASAEALEAAALQHTSARLRVEQASEAVKQSEALLAHAEDDLRKTTIFAPISGRVIALNAKEGEVVVSGTMNNPASVIGTIADLSQVLAEIDVDETEVIHLTRGQKAEVRVDSFPDDAYAGEVEEIGSSGYSKPTQPDVTFFRVKVLLGAPDARLRPGMSTRAEVAVASHDDALVVPIQSVVERRLEVGAKDRSARTEAEKREAKVVFAVESGKAVQHEVATGLSDATNVEIVSGLEAGQRVVTGPYRTLRKIESGDAIRVAKPGEEEKGAKNREEESD